MMLLEKITTTMSLLHDSMLSIAMSAYIEIHNLEIDLHHKFMKHMNTIRSALTISNETGGVLLESNIHTFCLGQFELIDMITRRVVYYMNVYAKEDEVIIRESFAFIIYI